ncbi:IDEAL domain-containing protein [Aureibacillus halotolerans]|uniref:IDEAL domain-containing protein n=1 Tax=Aureibacillus halotolerans TaxID=1508390 RepID=A0A4R6U8J0_9BACI|nr:IDEAL domain-containing protein [Aureibacillus halotolerans]TDQ42052.1 IDEAL domain-containing protein [Aureibacillus halotolerans]
MNNEYSSTEKMNASATSNSKNVKSFVLDLYIDMVLDEALAKARIQFLQARIDEALDKNDKEQFMTYSKEYQKLMTSMY